MSHVQVGAMLSGHFRLGSRLKTLATTQQDIGFPENQDRLEAFGFKLTEGGAHISRTMMLKEIARLLASAPAEASIDDYSQWVVEKNVLGKATETTKQKTFRHLQELYALSSTVPIFSVYRELITIDSQSGPLLSFLIVWARDPLL